MLNSSQEVFDFGKFFVSINMEIRGGLDKKILLVDEEINNLKVFERRLSEKKLKCLIAKGDINVRKSFNHSQ